MTHEAAWERLPDLLVDRDDRELLAHVNACHLCQARLFSLTRIDRALRRSRNRRTQFPTRDRVAASAAAAAAVVAAVFFGLDHGRSGPRSHFTFRTSSGAVVANASITRGDGANESVALVAHGLPADEVDTYVLWTSSPDSGRAVLIGRFMVSHQGECRARFNLAGRRHSSRFWITPAGAPAAVVATT